MIEMDDEFRGLFLAEAEEHLGILSDGILRLERDGSDEELLAQLFRSAHSLKGAAAVVGVDDATRVAHVLEELLSELRKGNRTVTPDLVEGLLAGVDGLAELIPAVLAGQDRKEISTRLTAQLEAVARGEAPPPAAAPAEAPAPAPAPASAPAVAVAEPVPGGPEEIVRVPVERLDELVRLVGESAGAQLRLGQRLSERLGQDPGSLSEFRDLLRVLATLQERTMRTRMVTLATIAAPLQRAARDVARATGKEIEWRLEGENTELDRHVLGELRDPLTHLVRNAIDHGLESPEERKAAGKPAVGTVSIAAAQVGSEVEITVSDDGGGIDVDAVRAKAGLSAGVSEGEVLSQLFRPGFSTAALVTDISGRGVGLDVVERAVERIRGRIEVRSTVGAGTSFVIRVPMNLAVLPCLLVSAGGDTYALPLHAAVAIADEPVDAEFGVEGRAAVRAAGEIVPVIPLARALGVHDSDPQGPVVVLSGAARRHAFRVDALIGRRDVVVKELSSVLPRLPVLSGASVEPGGAVMLVLDAIGLVGAARGIDSRRPAPLPSATAEVAEASVAAARGVRVLVVDDALTIRELQRSILERAGYEVVTAADGEEALARLAEQPAELVVTDVEMPRLDGFGLTERIREHPQLSSIPVIIVSSRAADEDRRRGLDAGADAYLVKTAFDEGDLLAAVERVLGG